MSWSAATTSVGTVTRGRTAVASYRNMASVPRARTAGDAFNINRVVNSSCPRDSVPANNALWFDRWADPVM